MQSFLSEIDFKVIQRQAQRLYGHQYFDHVLFISGISIAFILGRLLHEKKFSNLLNMINDAQTTRKAIQNEKKDVEESIRKTEGKKYIFLSLLFIVVAAIGAYVYIIKKVDINLMVKVGSGIVGVVLLIWLRLKYLKWKRSSLQNKLKQSQLTTQSQIKEILTQIGPQITSSLKFKLQRQIQDNYRKQQQKECQLNKCQNQKRTYEKLYILYKNIISQMTKFTWCKICSSQANINIMDLGLNELDANLVLYRKLSTDAKFLNNLEKCKELVNKMLEEWAKLEPKLEFVCKRGCCIRFRQLVDQLKNQNFRSLNQLKNSLKNS